MARAGVETWLMHALRRADRQRLEMDFLVHTDQPCAYDEEILGRHSRILRCTAPRHSPLYAQEIVRLFGQHHYDAVHSHVHHFSGYLLWLARRAGVPLRIAHSHSDTSRQDAGAGWARGAYVRLAKHWIRACATDLVAASRVAGRALFGVDWDTDARQRVLHCGIDLAPFRDTPAREAARAALGIAPGELVVGHTGRFAAPKNHRFLAEIAAETALRHSSVRLLLIGDGPERTAMEQKLRDLNLLGKTIFAGARPDVPDRMQAMDVFLFPSLWEGLPLTVLEAQAAGLPCVISDIISRETDVAPGLVRRVPLTAGAGHWAAEVLAAAHQPAVNRAVALRAVEQSSFNILHSMEELYGLYHA
jgi:glycosyltransferase involved in cell wall biosynthesis